LVVPHALRQRDDNDLDEHSSPGVVIVGSGFGEVFVNQGVWRFADWLGT
jgi:hypothetical protein